MSIAEKFEVIADAVYEKGIEKGKKDEYDKFWDSFQNKGKRVNYQNGFAGKGWNDTTFKPKYNIVPTGNGGNMFQETDLTDLEGILQRENKILNTSQCTTLQHMFYFSAYLTSVPEIDTSGTTLDSSSLTNAFSSCKKLKTIRKLILKADGSQKFSSTFARCEELENIVVEGTIGQNGFNVSACTKLSGASIVSIIEALSTTTSGLSVTLSQTAVNNMTFPITGNKGTYNSWTELEQSRTNWTISLV